MAACGERSAAIEYSDVVQAEEAAGEDVLTLWVLSVDPPAEVLHQTLKRSLQEP